MIYDPLPLHVSAYLILFGTPFQERTRRNMWLVPKDGMEITRRRRRMRDADHQRSGSVDSII